MTHRLILTVGLLLIGPYFGRAEEQLSEKARATAKKQLEQMVAEKKIVGGMHLVVQDAKQVHFHMAGVTDIEDQTPYQRDTIVRMYSMSKPITSVAAMTLWEQGKFKLDDPVSKYIPAFKTTQVQIKDGDKLALVKPNREITVRDVFRHSTGYSYGSSRQLKSHYSKQGILYDPVYGMFPPKMTIAKAAEGLARIPLAHHPGERFTYGFNTDLLGRLIEIWSGESLDQYFKRAIFDPLQMNDTAFAVGQAKKSRFASCHTLKDGKHIICDKAAESPFVDGFQFLSGGGGLVSTIDDYAKFCQLIVDKGKVGDTQVLKENTVDLILTNQMQGKFKFGLGFAITDLLVGSRKLKAYRWGGYASTAFQIVPDAKLFQITVQQSIRTPNQLAPKVFSTVYSGIE